MKKLLVIAVASLAVLGTASASPAEPVQQFSFQLTKLQPNGVFTLIFQARTFDTTGGVPPELLSNYLRLPAGAKLRPEFLNKRFFCNGPALRNTLDRHLEDSGHPFTKRVANLKEFIARLKKSKDRLDKRDLPNVETCDHARIGTGTAQIDARASIPVLNQLIPCQLLHDLQRTHRQILVGVAFPDMLNDEQIQPAIRIFIVMPDLRDLLLPHDFDLRWRQGRAQEDIDEQSEEVVVCSNRPLCL